MSVDQCLLMTDLTEEYVFGVNYSFNSAWDDTKLYVNTSTHYLSDRMFNLSQTLLSQKIDAWFTAFIEVWITLHKKYVSQYMRVKKGL